jgi:hypothetical protein
LISKRIKVQFKMLQHFVISKRVSCACRAGIFHFGAYVCVDETATIGSAFYGGDIAHAAVSSILVEPLVFGSSPSNKNMQL